MALRRMVGAAVGTRRMIACAGICTALATVAGKYKRSCARMSCRDDSIAPTRQIPKWRSKHTTMPNSISAKNHAKIPIASCIIVGLARSVRARVVRRPTFRTQQGCYRGTNWSSRFDSRSGCIAAGLISAGYDVFSFVSDVPISTEPDCRHVPSTLPCQAHRPTPRQPARARFS